MCSIVSANTKNVQLFSHCTSLERLIAEKDAFKLKRFEIEKIVKNFFTFEEEMNIGGKTHNIRIDRVMRMLANRWQTKTIKKRKKTCKK